MISLSPEFFVYLSGERRNERIVTKDWLFFYDGPSPVFLMWFNASKENFIIPTFANTCNLISKS